MELVPDGLLATVLETDVMLPCVGQGALGVRRVWVHTCTLDHPRALSFYLQAGFVAYERAVEVADDPRLTGEAPRTAAPHVPVIARASL